MPTKPKTSRRAEYKGELQSPIVVPSLDRLAQVAALSNAHLDQAIERATADFADLFYKKLLLLADHYEVDRCLPFDELNRLLLIKLCMNRVPGFKIASKPPKRRGVKQKDWAELHSFVELKLAAGMTVLAACREFRTLMPERNKASALTLKNNYFLWDKKLKVESAQSTQRLIEALMKQERARATGPGFFRMPDVELKQHDI